MSDPAGGRPRRPVDAGSCSRHASPALHRQSRTPVRRSSPPWGLAHRMKVRVRPLHREPDVQSVSANISRCQPSSTRPISSPDRWASVGRRGLDDRSLRRPGAPWRGPDLRPGSWNRLQQRTFGLPTLDRQAGIEGRRRRRPGPCAGLAAGGPASIWRTSIRRAQSVSVTSRGCRVSAKEERRRDIPGVDGWLTALRAPSMLRLPRSHRSGRHAHPACLMSPGWRASLT
jgi:hypothetical protein